MLATADYLLTEDEFNLVREVVHKHCGIALSDEKIMLVRARITKQMRAGGYTSASDYLKHVLADRSGQAFAGFIDAISTNLTSFFREKQHFDYLSDSFLPALLEKKRRLGDSRLLVWSAACSSGEEPYTLAMVLLDAIERFDPTFRIDVRILATDISTAMLAMARAGIYPATRVAPVPQAARLKYLKPVPGDDQYQTSPTLRQLIRFRHLNLMTTWPFKGPFDFIFCRNVMIYFDKSTQQGLVDRFWSVLAPGGLLFTGHSESLTGISHRFHHLRPSIYKKSDV